jgi:hypothetical protein
VDAGKTAVRVKTVSETKVCTELGRVKQRAYVQRQAAEVAGRKIAAMLIRTVSKVAKMACWSRIFCGRI